MKFSAKNLVDLMGAIIFSMIWGGLSGGVPDPYPLTSDSRVSPGVSAGAYHGVSPRGRRWGSPGILKKTPVGSPAGSSRGIPPGEPPQIIEKMI